MIYQTQSAWLIRLFLAQSALLTRPFLAQIAPTKFTPRPDQMYTLPRPNVHPSVQMKSQIVIPICTPICPDEIGFLATLGGALDPNMESLGGHARP